ncbi:hypothetical protein PF008_g9899 [Phytophthora fragariae]|uniref:Uncharacterized protein n=1 Tax=Phytophthora fragariae TaxID=53985 RepID=A0A6G0RVW0_9STRA|nr:hypothetical protein PF008_g9899 [Phytophthora fragariae]
MSPNATSVSSTEPELPILEAEKSEPVENNSIGDLVHIVKVFDYQKAKDSHDIADCSWMHQTAYKLVKEDGLKVDLSTRDGFKALKGSDKMLVQFVYFTCSEDKFDENLIPAKTGRYVFESESDFAPATSAMNKYANMPLIDLVFKSKDYDEYLYDLCSLINETWFRDSTNMWKFTRTVYHMQGDSMLYRRTFAAVLASKFGKHFDDTRAMIDYDRIGSDTKYKDQGSITTLKSVAGGSNAEGYKNWKAKYDPEPIKIKTEKKTTEAADSETGAKIESRLGKRWVAEVKRICEKTSIDYDKLLTGMLKTIEINGDYCMMDWRDVFIQPMNRITHDAHVLLAEFIAISGNWVYKNIEEAAKIAAQIIDPTIVLFANGDVFVRQKLDECEDDGAKKTPSALMKLINFRFFSKDAEGRETIRSHTLDRIMLVYSPMFHRYNRYVSRWDIDANDNGTFGMCAPYRGQMLSDDEYDPKMLNRFLEFVLEVICDGNQKKYKFFLDYCEHSIRFKNAKTGVAMIFYHIE